tara:strand:+ start:291 stop:692 length:402 start_codon:yes stop_codon:yes gene_type:complete
MPIYEYVCQSCGKEFEEMQRFSDAPLEQCLCEEKAPVQRKVSKSAFHLKGGGWYKDGYGSAKPESSSDSDSESKKSDVGSETKKTDSTAESKKSESSTESSSKEIKPAESSKSSDSSSSSSSSSSSGGKESAA